MMPVLKLSYSEIISEAKIKILKAIEQAGGIIESLEQLEHLSGYGKHVLSYHVQGGRDSKGLASLGLLDVERKDRGKISASITTLGKLLITSNFDNSSMALFVDNKISIEKLDNSFFYPLNFSQIFTFSF